MFDQANNFFYSFTPTKGLDDCTSDRKVAGAREQHFPWRCITGAVCQAAIAADALTHSPLQRILSTAGALTLWGFPKSCLPSAVKVGLTGMGGAPGNMATDSGEESMEKGWMVQIEMGPF